MTEEKITTALTAVFAALTPLNNDERERVIKTTRAFFNMAPSEEAPAVQRPGGPLSRGVFRGGDK